MTSSVCLNCQPWVVGNVIKVEKFYEELIPRGNTGIGKYYTNKDLQCDVCDDRIHDRDEYAIMELEQVDSITLK